MGRREDGVFLSYCLPVSVQAPPFVLSRVCVCVCTCGMGAIKLPSASDSPFSLHPALTHVNSFFFTALSLKLLSGVLLPAETLHLSFFSLLSSEGLDQD